MEAKAEAQRYAQDILKGVQHKIRIMGNRLPIPLSVEPADTLRHKGTRRIPQKKRRTEEKKRKELGASPTTTYHLTYGCPTCKLRFSAHIGLISHQRGQ